MEQRRRRPFLPYTENLGHNEARTKRRGEEKGKAEEEGEGGTSQRQRFPLHLLFLPSSFLLLFRLISQMEEDGCSAPHLLPPPLGTAKAGGGGNIMKMGRERSGERGPAFAMAGW